MSGPLPARRPAWSDAFAAGALPALPRVPLLEAITPEWAWGDHRGEGVKVAVIDSGIDAEHPAVGGVQGFLAIDERADGELVYRGAPRRSLRPWHRLRRDRPHAGARLRALQRAGARSLSRRPGQDLRRRAALGDRVRDGHLQREHELGAGGVRGRASRAGRPRLFRHLPLVCAASNRPGPSYPSLSPAVISVAATEETDPERIAFNPRPPVEFGAPGIGVPVAWTGGATVTATGNSFAAPHVAGLVARLLAAHPGLTVFQVKTVLRALASNVRD